MANSTPDNHARFIEHLDESHTAVVKVAEWLSKMGNTVQIAGLHKRKLHEDWKAYADGGDLFIQQRIEVKRRSVDFTSRKDWPYGDKFIVCAKHSFDRAKQKPYAYLILNSSMTHAAVVKVASSRKQWTVEQKTDTRYPDTYRQDFYLCPIELVRFIKL